MFIFDEQISRDYSLGHKKKIDLVALLKHVREHKINERCVLLIELPVRRRQPLTNFYALLIKAGWELRFHIPDITNALSTLVDGLIMDDNDQGTTNVLISADKVGEYIRDRWLDEAGIDVWYDAKVNSLIESNDLLLPQAKR